MSSRIEICAGVSVLFGDNRETLRELADESVDCCVTSPPYYGLRDYGHDGQIGLEPTPDEYVAALTATFREVHRVLRDDGTLWVNIGDTWAAQRGGTDMPAQTVAGGKNGKGPEHAFRGMPRNDGMRPKRGNAHRNASAIGLKHKDAVGIPWRLAFALQAFGWHWRQTVIWQKTNPTPESVRDRCTNAHEYVLFFSKKSRYWFDPEAMKEPATGGGTRNRRSVWTVPVRPYSGAHFAVFPPDLIAPCVSASCRPGGVVLDPFGGSGTTAGVALRQGKTAVLCEARAEYLLLMPDRIRRVASEDR